MLGGLARQRVARFAVAEGSMEPALRPGDWILAVKAHKPQRGDIVIYDLDELDVIKRVVGLPGEAVTIRGGQVWVDGEALPERWADGPTHPDGEWQLGATEVFCLGDARARSTGDGRTTGPVDESRIRWRAVAVYWPRPRRLR